MFCTSIKTYFITVYTLLLFIVNNHNGFIYSGSPEDGISFIRVGILQSKLSIKEYIRLNQHLASGIQ